MSESKVVLIAALSRPLWVTGLLALVISTGGCRSNSPTTYRRLIEHQAMIDFSGL